MFAFDKFTLQNLANKSGGVEANLLYFLYITSEVKQYYVSYRPLTECSISQFFKTNCTQSISRTFNRGLLTKPVQKISKITYTASRFSLLASANLQWTLIVRVTLQRNKEFIIFIFFLFNAVKTMCNLKKRLMRAAFWVLQQAMFMNDWKQTAQRLKLQERLLAINKRNMIRRNIYRDNHFHSRRQVLKCF